jgi:hypothetical protein
MSAANRYQTSGPRKAQCSFLFRGDPAAPSLWPTSAVVRVNSLVGHVDSLLATITDVDNMPATARGIAVLLILARGKVSRSETQTAARLYLPMLGWTVAAWNQDQSINQLTDGTVTLTVGQYDFITRQVTTGCNIIISVGATRVYYPATSWDVTHLVSSSARIPLHVLNNHHAIISMAVDRMEEWLTTNPELLAGFTDVSHTIQRCLAMFAGPVVSVGLELLFAPGLTFVQVVNAAHLLIEANPHNSAQFNIAYAFLALLSGTLSQAERYDFLVTMRSRGATPRAIYAVATQIAFFLPMRPEAIENFVKQDGSALETKAMGDLLAEDTVLLNNRPCSGGQISEVLGNPLVRVAVVPSVSHQMYRSTGKRRNDNTGAANSVREQGEANTLFKVVSGIHVKPLSDVVVLPGAPNVIAPMINVVNDGGF